MHVTVAEPSATLTAVTVPVKRHDPDVLPPELTLGDGTFAYDAGEQGEPCSPSARVIERSARVCWKSEGKAGKGTAAPFLERVVKKFGHQSVAEHASATVWFVTDRVTSHQLVRARIAAYSQESTHYLNYAKRDEALVVVPKELRDSGNAEDLELFLEGCQRDFDEYEELIRRGYKHYTARFKLPMALKTEVVATYNFRTWDHVLRQRTSDKNTPEIIELMRMAGRELAHVCPELFGEWA